MHYYDGVVIKYNSSGEVEWANAIQGVEHDYINSVAKCKDGGYIVGGESAAGSSSTSNIDLGNGLSITNRGGILIKYNSVGKVEWARGKFILSYG